MAYQPGKPKPSWDSWYKTYRWQRRRIAQLRAFPWCTTCETRGTPTAATVVDHVEPHHGDHRAFWFGKLQSLCKQCHDSTKRIEELRGYSTEIGLDGWPVDPSHPVYQGIPGFGPPKRTTKRAHKSL
jgi:hypothetical protein